MSASSDKKSANMRYHIFWTPNCNKTEVQYFGSHATVAEAKAFLTLAAEEELKVKWSRDCDNKLADTDEDTEEIHLAAQRVDTLDKEYYAFDCPDKDTLDNLLLDEPNCLNCPFQPGFGLLWIILSDDKPSVIKDKLMEAGYGH